MKVFLVDDDLKVLVILSRILKESNIKGAFSATSTAGIVEKILDFLPDIIILDLYMPDRDGWGLYQDLRKIKELEHIPILATSSSDDMDDRLRTINTGFNQFLPKPITKESLLKAINTEVALSEISKSISKTLTALEGY
jgi:DNA-binding response OmpR family regulator